MKKKALLTAAVAVAAAVVKKSKARRAEKDLWNEAGQTAGQGGSDLR